MNNMTKTYKSFKLIIYNYLLYLKDKLDNPFKMILVRDNNQFPKFHYDKAILDNISLYLSVIFIRNDPRNQLDINLNGPDPQYI